MQESTGALWGERRAAVVERLTCQIDGIRVPLAVRELSLGGFSLDLDSALKIGSVHQCTFTLDGRTIRVLARVTDRRYRADHGSHRVGFAFRCLTARERDAVERLAAGLLGFSNS